MLRVLIADDHPVLRRGLKQIIDDTPDMRVADEAVDGWDALRKATTGDFDIVLLDISMPFKNGLDVLSQLKAAKPALPVLVLSMHPEEQYAVRALKTGASGYLTKESAPEEMLSAVRKVSGGGKFVSASLAETLASMLDEDDERLPHEALSNREYQVMRLIASGKSVSEIAEDLSLSVKTISTYRARILEKMRMTNNAQIIRYATKNDLVD
jgi:two-component system, NarL family, invasion response regulator UvrY